MEPDLGIVPARMTPKFLIEEGLQKAPKGGSVFPERLGIKPQERASQHRIREVELRRLYQALQALVVPGRKLLQEENFMGVQSQTSPPANRKVEDRLLESLMEA